MLGLQACRSPWQVLEACANVSVVWLAGGCCILTIKLVNPKVRALDVEYDICENIISYPKYAP